MTKCEGFVTEAHLACGKQRLSSETNAHAGGTDAQCNMLFFFKVNSEHELEWKEDQDLTTWVVIVEVVVHQQGFSTYIASNNKTAPSITEKFPSNGHFKIRLATQFDVVLEANLFSFSSDMPVIGIDALRAFVICFGVMGYSSFILSNRAWTLAFSTVTWTASITPRL